MRLILLSNRSNDSEVRAEGGLSPQIRANATVLERSAVRATTILTDLCATYQDARGKEGEGQNSTVERNN